MMRDSEIFLDKIKDDYFENLIPNIFGENHIKIKTFEDFKNSVKHGKITLNITYSSKLAKELLQATNYSFFNGISIIKKLGIIILLIYVLIKYQDYNFLFVLPAAFIINMIILYFWNRKLITFFVLIIFIITTTTYLELNIYYNIFLIGFTVLQSIAFSAYSNFLNEYFSYDEFRLDHGIEHKLILQIYDNYTKTLIKI